MNLQIFLLGIAISFIIILCFNYFQKRRKIEDEKIIKKAIYEIKAKKFVEETKSLLKAQYSNYSDISFDKALEITKEYKDIAKNCDISWDNMNSQLLQNMFSQLKAEMR